jgi:hypothetical protein
MLYSPRWEKYLESDDSPCKFQLPNDAPVNVDSYATTPQELRQLADKSLRLDAA